MIAQLRGTIVSSSLEEDALHVVIDVGGVGYELQMSKASEGRVNPGQPATLLVAESVAAFEGSTTLFGFVSQEEKDFFQKLRKNVDGMGPKKALETLDKISKSMPDFKRAVIDGDVALLVSVFGFTKKTAEKLIFALKGKVDGWFAAGGATRWHEAPRSPQEADALSGLVHLGYREEEAREILSKAKAAAGAAATAAELIKEALRISGARLS
ncbi:MAG: Holliday junction branch migration protein RuvA [Elusimicrobia bacterium]|nr:Holliday junction branch migration protein RuvA [Elusimicrobiota bacterium]